jgi:hypothetical protein
LTTERWKTEKRSRRSNLALIFLPSFFCQLLCPLCDFALRSGACAAVVHRLAGGVFLGSFSSSFVKYFVFREIVDVF